MNPHKTKKTTTLLLFSVLFMYILTTGCIENQEDTGDDDPLAAERERFIGSWKGTQTYMGHESNISMVCLSDGSFSSGNIMLTSGWWTLRDNRFTTTSTEGVLTTYRYMFSENDTRLILTCDTIDVQLTLAKQMN